MPQLVNIPIIQDIGPPQLSNLTVDYVELVADYGHFRGRFGWDDTQVMQTIDLVSYQPWNDLTLAVYQILGYHQTTDYLNLTRNPPIRHPKFPWLYANSIPDVTAVAPTSTFSGPQQAATDTDTSGYQSATYQRPRLTISFQTLPYVPYFRDVAAATLTPTNPAYAGQTVMDETQRYCYRLTNPSAQASQLNNGTFQYLEGVPSGRTYPQANGGLQRIIPTADIVLVWAAVPEDYLMNTKGPVNFTGDPDSYDVTNVTPYDLTGAVGKVNFTEFLGYAPGTLLMYPPQITPRMSPVATSFNNDIGNVRIYDVQVNMKLFDPPLGPGATTRGWNTAYFYDGFNYRIGAMPAVGVFQGAWFNKVQGNNFAQFAITDGQQPPQQLAGQYAAVFPGSAPPKTPFVARIIGSGGNNNVGNPVVEFTGQTQPNGFDVISGTPPPDGNNYTMILLAPQYGQQGFQVYKPLYQTYDFRNCFVGMGWGYQPAGLPFNNF